jgi:hypothetical protein
MRGWLKWSEGGVVAADMGFVRDNFPVKHRYALGDLDESLWEKAPDGEPRDPWSRSYRALLIEISAPHGDVTFSGSSYGAHLALQDICRVYAAERQMHPDAYPVVQLTTKTRQNKHYGAIKGPWFNVVGWATPDNVRAGRKATAPVAKVEQKPKAAKSKAPADFGKQLNDAIPDWGKPAA